LAQFDHGKVYHASGSVRFMSILLLDFQPESGLADARKEGSEKRTAGETAALLLVRGRKMGGLP
jgi:hypothetical protein